MTSGWSKSIWFLGLAVCVLLLGIWRWTERQNRVDASLLSGRQKAEALVAAYARHVGAHDAVHQTLDAADDRSFGDFGFHYFAQTDLIQARVFFTRSHLKDWPQTIERQKMVHAGLNDPKIGGMYDRGGGHFVVDDEKQMIFLVKEYPVSSTNTAEFIKDVDNLNQLGAIWLTSWGGHVALQSYGAEPLPTQHITRENDPYEKH